MRLFPSALSAAELAATLAGEGDHAGAAIEFRRLALAAPGAEARGGYFWAAAHEYWKAGEYDASDRMLNRAEDAAPGLASQALLLRGENAVSAKRNREAAFYWQALLGPSAGHDVSKLAARRLAVERLREKDAQGARQALLASPERPEAELAALERYEAGRDKSPRIGGWLGAIPGMGYFYAGEYASGVRSIILNALFIFGMVDTADEEQWGAFAAITFFEFTWYSGSIYGGIDAAHRYNRRRFDGAAEGIEGNAGFEPDYDKLPAVSLRFRF